MSWQMGLNGIWELDWVFEEASEMTWMAALGQWWISVACLYGVWQISVGLREFEYLLFELADFLEWWSWWCLGKLLVGLVLTTEKQADPKMGWEERGGAKEWLPLWSSYILACSPTLLLSIVKGVFLE